MKTKLSLSILGVYNTLMGVIMMFFASALGNEIVLSENTDVIRMGELFHYGPFTCSLDNWTNVISIKKLLN